MASDRLGWFLALSGLALGVGGAIYLAKHGPGSGLRGRFIAGRAAQAPIVGETRVGGMKVQHRRANNMSIEQRVASIQDLVWKGVNNPEMRKLALQVTRHCPERDKKCEARAVYDYVKKHVRYTGDVAPVKMGSKGPVEAIDFYQSSNRTLEFAGGDCDDHSVLVSVLLSLNGIPARLRVTADNRWSDWSHIFPVANLDGNRWTAVDTTLPGSKFGTEVPSGKKLDFPA